MTSLPARGPEESGTSGHTCPVWPLLVRDGHVFLLKKAGGLAHTQSHRLMGATASQPLTLGRRTRSGSRGLSQHTFY